MLATHAKRKKEHERGSNFAHTLSPRVRESDESNRSFLRLCKNKHGKSAHSVHQTEDLPFQTSWPDQRAYGHARIRRACLAVVVGGWVGGGGGYGIHGHFGSRDSSGSSPSTHRAATTMASVSVPLHIQGASKLVDAPSVGPAMLLKCEFVIPLLDLVNAMVEYQKQHEATPAACAEPRRAPSAHSRNQNRSQRWLNQLPLRWSQKTGSVNFCGVKL